MRNGKTLMSVLIAIILAGSLVNSGHFESPTMTAYFFYVIAGAALVFFASVAFAAHSSAVKVSNVRPLVLLTALTIYYFIQSIFLNRYGPGIMHFLLLINCVLLIACCILFKLYEVSIVRAYNIIALLAAAESVCCLLQFIGWMESPARLFPVSGTWVNPNVTAMFLVMAVPACVSLYFQQLSRYRNLYLIVLVSIAAALITLKCRTALIGLFVSSAVFAGIYKGQLLQSFRKRLTGMRAILLLVFITGLVCSFFIWLYFSKQASAEGRRLIWKVSAGMVTEKPVAGYGYGQFEHDYNLAQAAWFGDGQGSAAEIRNAGYVNMAYNELLQHQVEGGIIASVLLVLFFLSLVAAIPSAKNKVVVIGAYTAICGFIAMSVFNFTMQAIPAMALFIIYAAVTTSSLQPRAASPVLLPKPLVCSVLLLVAGYIGISQIRLAEASAASRKIFSLAMQRKGNLSLQKLDALENRLIQSEIYWTNYGTLLLKQRNYSLALDKFRQAALLKSHPDTYLKMAICYQKSGKADSSIAACMLAKNMIPNRLAPLFSLMVIYTGEKDAGNARHMAEQIIAAKPKVPSKEADYYKQVANKVLNKLSPQHDLE